MMTTNNLKILTHHNEIENRFLDLFSIFENRNESNIDILLELYCYVHYYYNYSNIYNDDITHRCENLKNDISYLQNLSYDIKNITDEEREKKVDSEMKNFYELKIKNLNRKMIIRLSMEEV